MANNNFFYDHQIEKYIQQFLRIFKNLQVKHGVDRGDDQYKNVNVIYSSKERLSSKLLSNRSRWSAASLPIITAYITGFELQKDKSVSQYHIDPIVYKDNNDELQSYIKTIGPSYKTTVNTYLLADSNDEMMQLLEQILLIFNPSLIIQKSEEILDQHYLTEVRLTNIEEDETVPLDNNSAANTYTLTFEFEIRLQYPEQAQKAIQNIRSDIITYNEDSTLFVEGEQ